jgi:hypothetical protein
MTMVLRADDQRTDELRLIGQRLVATGRVGRCGPKPVK